MINDMVTIVKTGESGVTHIFTREPDSSGKRKWDRLECKYQMFAKGEKRKEPDIQAKEKSHVINDSNRACEQRGHNGQNFQRILLDIKQHYLALSQFSARRLAFA
jgi:hypothetical protein